MKRKDGNVMPLTAREKEFNSQKAIDETIAGMMDLEWAAEQYAAPTTSPTAEQIADEEQWNLDVLREANRRL